MNEEEKKYELTLHPGDIAEAMGTAGPSQRDDPLALNYPAKINQVITAQMFDKWSVTAKNQTINNAFYRFSEEAKVDGRSLSFTYTYEALADRVAPSDLPTYNAGLSKIRDKLGYTLFYQKPAASLNFANWAHQLNWPILWLTAGVAMVTFILCGVYFIKSKLPVPLPPVPDTPLEREGLGGWLILVGIHHFVRPFLFIAPLVVLFPTVFNLETWHAFTEPGGIQFHPYYKPMLLSELFFHVVCLIVSGLLLLLFLWKRAVWPRCYAAFLLFVLFFSLLDFFLAQKIPAATASQSENIRDLVQVIVAAAIWVPYCFVSKRVKATFRR
jgi:hypothetical protein